MNFGIAPRGDKGVEIAKMGVDLGVPYFNPSNFDINTIIHWYTSK
jgi:hypothetical protein